MKTLTYRGIAHSGTKTTAQRPGAHLLTYRGADHAPAQATTAATPQEMVYRGVAYRLTPRTGAVTLEAQTPAFEGRLVMSS